MWFDKSLGLEFNGNNGGIEVLTSHYLCHIFNDFHVKEKQILLLFPKYMVAIVHTFEIRFLKCVQRIFIIRFIPSWNK